MRIALVSMLLMLSACVPVPIKSLDAGCAEICFEPCKPWEDWDGDLATLEIAATAWGAQYEQCEIKRMSCANCLQRLKNNNIIK